MLNRKLEVRETKNLGRGVFAKENISKGEIIADWTGGKVYRAERCSDLPKDIADHAIQFSEHRWIDISDGCYVNHSCSPNCGFNGKFKLVAMKNIPQGEQITFDYDMSEDSDWKMECRCGSKNCRKIIGSFKNLPEKFRTRYGGYLSGWLIEKYGLGTF